MTDKEKAIKKLKEVLDSLDITNKYRLNLIEAIECLQDEPVSEDLEEYSASVADELPQGTALTSNGEFDIASVRKLIIDACKYGAKWQQEQFEKERLKHCDDLTAEQAQIESDFVVNHMKKHNRTPTFIDAIEYGMRLQKEKMIANAVDGICISNGAECGASIESSAGMLFLQHNTFDVGDKVKLIIVNED